MKAEDVQWVVNDIAELGVKIGDQFFWLYKGGSFVYPDGKHDDGTTIRWRLVGKREFGESCVPVYYWMHPNEGVPFPYLEGEGWQELPISTATLTASQLKAARALVNWSQKELARRANVGTSTVADFERGKRVPILNNLEAMRAALEEAGVRFQQDGVVLNKE